MSDLYALPGYRGAGRFDGKVSTVHFGYARPFAAAYPGVPIHPERVLVISGRREARK